ncbi:MAG: Glutamate--tRNA ligase 1 [candidate division WS2 bacterium]|nr:Glutamate--tRNA ligase 1 [Candidatus Psychracetigena formicireducens]
MSNIRVRFPPSPTGYFHLGNARTAIFNWLFARKEKGVFVLRIEDTDPTRSKKEYETAMMEDLLWMGLRWDEGPDVGGPYAPYRQSERLAIYQEYAQALLKENKAYECFCSADYLENEREEAVARGAVPRYNRRCRELSDIERIELKEKGVVPAIRVKTLLQGEIVVEDIIRGNLVFAYEDLDDFIILRSDKTSTYNFAVVIDDYLMKITHVIRGEDHLHGNTPRQIVVYQKLGWKTPFFGHLPMVLGKDKTKLSKRHGAMAVEEYRQMGYLPQSITNYLALLGWSAGDERELFDLEELIRVFDLSRVGKSPAIFDEEKLRWINHHHISNLDEREFFDISLPYLIKAGYQVDKKDIRLMKLINIIKSSLHMLEELPVRIKFYFYSPELFSISPSEKEILERVRKNVLLWESDLTVDEANLFLNELSPLLGLPKKGYLPLIRKALTGEEKGVELNIITSSLGREEVLKRLDAILIKHEK